jgi:DNA-binding ferritin-like protein
MPIKKKSTKRSSKVTPTQKSSKVTPIKKSSKITNKKTDKSRSELVNSFLQLLINVKVYHWRTKSYAVHKATDELYENLNEYIDKFVEVMLGKEGSRLDMKDRKIIITDPSTKTEFKKIMYDYRVLLEDKMNQYISEKGNTDLYNIRDEILGNINQFLYLITFE